MEFWPDQFVKAWRVGFGCQFKADTRFGFELGISNAGPDSVYFAAAEARATLTLKGSGFRFNRLLVHGVG